MLSERVKDPQLKRWGSGDPQRPSEKRRRFPQSPDDDFQESQQPSPSFPTIIRRKGTILRDKSVNEQRPPMNDANHYYDLPFA
ncbi:MAG: hypothetical protein IJ726_07490 [Phocaeicola sp.]|nr:hypothetical protein [Phocaeicola sp.]